MKINNLIYSLLGVVIFSSCTQDLDIGQIKFEEKLVLNALVTNIENAGVAVSNTVPIDDSTPPKPLLNCKVNIIDMQGKSTPMTYSFVSNKYIGAIIPKAGEKYIILVEHPKYGAAQGEFLMPSNPIGLPSTWKDNTGFDANGNPTGTITCYINDDGDTRNYYEVNLYRYNDFLAEWFQFTPVSNDPEISENSIVTDLGGLLLSDKSFNGKTKQISFNTEYASAGNQYKYLVEIKSLSAEYYQYFQSVDAYENNNSIFPEPQPILSNVTGGRGICAGASVLRDTIR
jgi:hypothetical protein